MKLRNMTSVYFVRGEELLCLYRIGSRVANEKYVGAAGGHFEQEELNCPRACVLREMKEELGLEAQDLSQLQLRYITLRLVQGEIRQNYYYFAQLKDEKPLSSTEGVLRWVPFSQVSELVMPISAKHMILHYLQEGRFTDSLYGGITRPQGTAFAVLEDFPG